MTSLDSQFTVYEGRTHTIEDDYEIMIDQKWQTVDRLEREINEWIDDVFLSRYPHRSEFAVCGFVNEREIDYSKFELNMVLDKANPPIPLELTIWSETEQQEPTWEELARYLKDMAQLTQELGINVEYFSAMVEFPYDSKDVKPNSSGVCVYGVPRKVIEEDEIMEYLEQVQKELEQEKEAMSKEKRQKEYGES